MLIPCAPMQTGALQSNTIGGMC